ncbi:peptidase M23 [Alisedimentitalea sp. MJ-SS2]|uniref:peptidase M23 n=1 Tax=Aliisedimentitalea sp. MJ-SS2 TaxID=3049795 RepID=UPI00290AAB2B|nr:peptidase M23 [Alisedimentitalea sp. MJ-SS2]MDU8928071.1 peptidase M23 [Alisedimentitalea sp. MJ-SS2]
MKPALTALVALTAAPAFAHSGAHMHPHANDPSWLPFLIGGLVVAGAAGLAWTRSK